MVPLDHLCQDYLLGMLVWLTPSNGLAERLPVIYGSCQWVLTVPHFNSRRVSVSECPSIGSAGHDRHHKHYAVEVGPRWL